MVTDVSRVRRLLLVAVATAIVVLLLFGYRTSTMGVGVADSSVPEVTISAGAAETPEDLPDDTPSAEAAPEQLTQTYAGTAAQTRYGPVQVEVTVTGSTITNVAVPQYPNSDRRDAEINARALPILTQQTIDTQSAEIDMVSGATYTSEGYRESLQAALDQAGL